MVLESTIQGHTLFALGYKYSSRKTIFFLFTEGSGHTEPGKPYEAKWQDLNGGKCIKYVPRPSVCADYFLQCNVIDNINQSRQFDLRLEKHWITNNGFFRIATTLFGQTVTDAWNGYQHHLGSSHYHKGQTIVDFLSILVPIFISPIHISFYRSNNLKKNLPEVALCYL